MNTTKTPIKFILFCIFINQSLAFAWEGRVVSVSDGDTLKVLHYGKEEKVRLYGVDAPEKKQPYGMTAKKFTADLCFGKTVEVKEKTKDKYGRTIGEVFLPDGMNLSIELLKSGYAWWYRQYAKNRTDYRDTENEARTQRIGLWNDKNPVAPWVWRHIR